MDAPTGRVAVNFLDRKATVHDPIFGTHSIREPVLVALMASPTATRLQRIHQAGASYLVKERRDLSRFDHSVGVMLGIRHLGGSIDEQLAGLLHDVGHTAFSHVVDYAMANAEEDFHEQQLVAWIEETEIPDLLSAHGFEARRVLDAGSWQLLDRPAPDLCIDRIDYTLRDLLHLGRMSTEEVAAFVGSLVVQNQKIVVEGGEQGLWFVNWYHKEVTELFMDPVESYANASMGEAIRLALANGVISQRDLFLDDQTVLDRVTAAAIPTINELLGSIRPSVRILAVQPSEGALHVKHKYRVVDPVVQVQPGVLARCSDLDPRVLSLHEHVRSKARTGTWLASERVRKRGPWQR